ncbi:hypothetical protein SLE2022_262250 [Rubroshorea leprosula]
MLTGVVATGKIVGSIFLATDELLGVEELAVGTSPHSINNSGLKINKDSARDVLSDTSFTKKGVEGSITSTDGLFTCILPSGSRQNPQFSSTLPANLNILD